MEIKPYVRKANYYETDQMGVIHHSNYIRWFEEARVDFMEQIGFGYGRSVDSGIDFALLDAYCQYKSMVRFGDTVHIYMTIPELTRTRMVVDYKVLDAMSGQLRSLGRTSHCYYDGKKQRPVSLQKAIPELYERLSQFAEGQEG